MRRADRDRARQSALCEQRLERARQDVGRHSVPIVGHAEADVRALRQSRSRRGFAAVVFAPRAQPYRAGPIRQRLGSIRAEIDQKVLEVGRVAPDLRQLIGEIELEAHTLTQRGAQEIGGILHDIVHADGIERSAMASRVHQHLRAEPGRTTSRRTHLLEMREHAEAIVDVGDGELGAPHDRCQQVVEVVRDSTSEHTEAFTPLCVEHFALQPEIVCLRLPPRRDVIERGNDGVRR